MRQQVEACHAAQGHFSRTSAESVLAGNSSIFNVWVTKHRCLSAVCPDMSWDSEKEVSLQCDVTTSHDCSQPVTIIHLLLKSILNSSLCKTLETNRFIKSVCSALRTFVASNWISLVSLVLFALSNICCVLLFCRVHAQAVSSCCWKTTFPITKLIND